MFDNSHWSKTQFLLEKAMDVSMLRGKVIADNMSNVDVPHFKRSDVTFEAQLRRALDTEKTVQDNEIPARMTDAKHIPFFRSPDFHRVEPKVNLDYMTSMRNDGNNVDMEHETNEFLKNRLRYELLANKINSNFRLMNIVLRVA